MKILNITTLTSVFLLMSLIGKAEYILKEAFPNLPSFAYPIELVHAYDGTNRLFIAQQFGNIYVFNNSPAVSSRKLFINLTGKVSQSGGEMGLLGLAFHPDYENNRYFYVNFTFDSASAFWQRISRFTADSANPDTAFINSELILITLRHPYAYHNGGKLAFGPDGYLYISFGDGGSEGDFENRAQNKADLLGKILRINVDSATAGMNYSIPQTNPFFGNSQGYKEEIYSYGLRNTWKFSIDYSTNTIWAGDVGVNSYEEVNIIQSGQNYGWRCFEGNHIYNPFGCSAAVSYTFPVWEYVHNSTGGFSITGGYVYRGALMPELNGKYIYGDFVSGKIWALTYDGINTDNELLLDSTYNLSSFGVDQNNNFYVCTWHPINGRIYTVSNSDASVLDLKAAIQGFYDSANNRLNVRDTVRVFLHSAASPYPVVDSAKTVIDSLNLKGFCFFYNIPTGSYYIRTKHRNALETWSKSGGVIFTKGNVINYDFTSDSLQAFGNNLILKGSIYTIYSGDVSQDGIVDASDLSITDNAVFNSLSGYINADVNGDRFVDASDLSIVDNNAARSVIAERP